MSAILEQAIQNTLETTLTTVASDKIFWGKIPTGTEFGDPVINFFRVPSLGSNITPTQLAVIQFSIRAAYIDEVRPVVDEIIKLFQLFSGDLLDEDGGSIQTTAFFINDSGTLYEEENICVEHVSFGYKI